MSKDNEIVDVSPGKAEAPTEIIVPPAGVSLPAVARLPAVVPSAKKGRAARSWLKRGLLLLVLMLGATGAGYWWLHSGNGLPPGIASGNGRLEADEIDIDTKFAGRIAKLLVDEGDLVHEGQVVALMDTRDLEASLRKAESVVLQAQKSLDEAQATVQQQKSQVILAQQEVGRAHFLVPKGFMPKEMLDQRQQQLDGADRRRERRHRQSRPGRARPRRREA